MRILTVMLILIAVWGCRRAPTPATLPGVFIGSYGGGSERFDIRGDGTFTQTFTKGGSTVYANQGTWELVGTRVRFFDFISAIDEFDSTVPPKKVDLAAVEWDGDSRITFGDEADYWAVRQPGIAAAPAAATTGPVNGK